MTTFPKPLHDFKVDDRVVLTDKCFGNARRGDQGVVIDIGRRVIRVRFDTVGSSTGYNMFPHRVEKIGGPW